MIPLIQRITPLKVCLLPPNNLYARRRQTYAAAPEASTFDPQLPPESELTGRSRIHFRDQFITN